MDFGEAIKLIKSGERLSRRGWNGKGMYVFLVKYDDYRLSDINRPESDYPVQSSLFMKTAQDMIVPWAPVQSDVLGEDWGVCYG